MFDKITELLAKIFGTKSERDLKKIWPIVDEINSFDEEMKSLSDEELRSRTDKFRRQIDEATADLDERIEEIRTRLNSNQEDLTVDENRRLSEELEELEDAWLQAVEDKMEELLPEAFAVLKDTCRRFVGKSWKVAGT
ncbi:MAG: preprotein translocase subunit SecA, partial [Balneolaceae bacterium]|nr:preprotein translocase subunit SecA [Balneolaceae bacterium]